MKPNQLPKVGNARFTDRAERELFDAAEADSEDLADIFKRNSAWGALIVAGEAKGTYRFCLGETGTEESQKA